MFLVWMRFLKGDFEIFALSKLLCFVGLFFFLQHLTFRNRLSFVLLFISFNLCSQLFLSYFAEWVVFLNCFVKHSLCAPKSQLLSLGLRYLKTIMPHFSFSYVYVFFILLIHAHAQLYGKQSSKEKNERMGPFLLDMCKHLSFLCNIKISTFFFKRSAEVVHLHYIGKCMSLNMKR